MATLRFDDGSSAVVTPEATWTSDAPAVATVGAGGLVNAVSVGTAGISATHSGHSGSAVVTVSPAELDSIVVTPDPGNLPAGTDLAFVAMGQFSNGPADVTEFASWSVDAGGASTATVSNVPGTRGLVHGLVPGVTRVAASLGGMAGSAEVRVGPGAFVSLALVPDPVVVPAGRATAVQAMATYTDGTRDVTEAAAWSTADPSIADVDDSAGSRGRVRGHVVGTTMVFASLASPLTLASANVTVGPPEQDRVDVRPLPAAVDVGATLQLSAMAVYSDGSEADLTDQCTWVSSNTAKATVGNVAGFFGLVRGVMNGTAQLTATCGGTAVPVTVTVQGANVAFTIRAQNGDFASWANAGSLTGLAAADFACQREAGVAGLPGTFVAWASDDADDAWCRVHGLPGRRADSCGLGAAPTPAGPWMQADASPFSATADLLLRDDAAIYNPLKLNARGSFSEGGLRRFTGTRPDGTAAAGYHCNNWTSMAGNAQRGSPYRTAVGWTRDETGAFCGASGALACLQTGAGRALPPFAVTGLRVFVTSTSGTGNLATWAGAGGATGLAAGDAICRARALAAGMANSDRFTALLSDATTSAASRVTGVGPFVRPDGVLIAATRSQLLAEHLTSITVDENGAYVGDGVAWTGSADGSVGSFHCSGWTSAGSSLGQVGSLTTTWHPDWVGQGISMCGQAIPRLYCVEN